MNATMKHPIADFFEIWRAEDRALESNIDEIRDWMHEVDQLGIPHFGETATRLGPLRDRLIAHFHREDEMIGQLAELYPSSSPEIDSVRRQSVRDHHQLLSRLDDLTARLDEIEPPFASWQAAMDELESFVDLLEQHEEQESDSIRMLMPTQL